MNIKRAKEEIKNSIEAYLVRDEFGEYMIPTMRQRPILILGAPGIGKTQIMEQIARECRIGLVSYTITHHTRQSAIGLPFISQKQYGDRQQAVTEYTMSEIVASIYDKIEKSGLKEGILFIDEINCVSETLAPAMLQFLQCKTFGSHAIPGGWMIVAAGNPPEYNKSVREFDVVTMDRVKKIQVEPDLKVWKEYAYQEQVHPAVISYLNIRPNYFYMMEQTVDGKQFVTPRGWEDLSNLINVYEKLGKTVDREVVEQYLQHPKAAKDFANYLELYYKYQTDYQVEAVLQGEIAESVLKKAAHSSFDEHLSLLGLLLGRWGVMCRSVQEQEDFAELLLQQLKEYRVRLTENPDCSPAAELEGLSAELQSIYEQQKTAEILSRREAHTMQRTLEALEKYVQELRVQERSAEEAFSLVRSSFAEERACYEEQYDNTGKALEYIFDFVEAAFGESQEMVVFLTELNSSPVSLHFLQTYECERYYRYNKGLLMDEGHAAIRRRLEELQA